MISYKILILFFFFTTALLAVGEDNNLKFTGNTNYMRKHSASLVTRIDADYAILLFKSRHEKWAISLNGKVFMDYDHFGNEIKTNAFTTIGVEF